MLWVALVATCLGLAVQAWAQGALTATSAAVIMTMEPVFAALLAVVVAGEVLAPAAWLGGLLVVVAMGTAEIGVRDCCDVDGPASGVLLSRLGSVPAVRAARALRALGRSPRPSSPSRFRGRGG